ncbi:MAG: SMC-Scp complex subunit ScpB [Caldilineaceae bacterium]|nr:SMC-Scp complex subunit ScpB [Caldilineaceae bacterium]
MDAAQFAKALNLSPAQIDAGWSGWRCSTAARTAACVSWTGAGATNWSPCPRPQASSKTTSTWISTRLSGPALETLAVIAYRQPVTRAQVEAVRGVDCSGVLRSLLQRGLIEDAGRLETVGRPILYSVTDLFMQHFGLTGMNELPELKTDEADTLWAATELALDADALPGDPLPTTTRIRRRTIGRTQNRMSLRKTRTSRRKTSAARECGNRPDFSEKPGL